MPGVIDPAFHELNARLSEAESLLNVLNQDVLALKAGLASTDSRVIRGDRIVAEVQMALQDMRRKLEAAIVDWEHLGAALESLKTDSAELKEMVGVLLPAIKEIQRGMRSIAADDTNPIRGQKSGA